MPSSISSPSASYHTAQHSFRRYRRHLGIAMYKTSRSSQGGLLSRPAVVGRCWAVAGRWWDDAGRWLGGGRAVAGRSRPAVCIDHRRRSIDPTSDHRRQRSPSATCWGVRRAVPPETWTQNRVPKRVVHWKQTTRRGVHYWNNDLQNVFWTNACHTVTKISQFMPLHNASCIPQK